MHSPPLVSIARARERLESATSKNAAQQEQGGATICSRTAVSVSASARVLDHSLWYGDKLVAQ